MITLVTGGSGSGKSAYAEELLSFCEGTKYYIATMQIYDAEGEKKVERHRKLRAGKGFFTIESPTDIDQIDFSEAKEQKKESPQDVESQSERKKSALLECMSNLTANEMFSNGSMRSADEVVQKITADIQNLAARTDELVIVTNNVFEDGIVYDDGTMEYLKALGRINTNLAVLSDRVVDVVVGIPVGLKPQKSVENDRKKRIQ